MDINFPNEGKYQGDLIKKQNDSHYFINMSLNGSGVYVYSFLVSDAGGNTIQSDNFSFFVPDNWDVNMDGDVNLLDLIKIAIEYGLRGEKGWIRSDVDNNGIIDLLDFLVVGNHFD